MPFVMQAMEPKVDGISDVAHVCRKKGAFFTTNARNRSESKDQPVHMHTNF